MNYSAILRRAWHVTWRHRALWLFGILLAVFGGGGGGSDGGRSGARFSLLQVLQWHEPAPPFPWSVSWPAVMAFILVLLALAFVLFVLGIAVRYTSEGALIGMVDEVERSAVTSIRSGFRTGWARLLYLFAITLVIGVPVAALALLLLVVVASPLVLVAAGSALDSAVPSVIGVVGVIGLALLWGLLVMVLLAAADLLLQFVYRRCVLEGEAVFPSITSGFQMVRRNLRDTGLMWLLLFGISLALSVVLVPVALIGLGLAAVPALLTRSAAVGIATGLPLLGLLVAAAIFAGGLYNVFSSAVWTLTYREIAAREQAGPLAGQQQAGRGGGHRL